MRAGVEHAPSVLGCDTTLFTISYPDSPRPDRLVNRQTARAELVEPEHTITLETNTETNNDGENDDLMRWLKTNNSDEPPLRLDGEVEVETIQDHFLKQVIADVDRAGRSTPPKRLRTLADRCNLHTRSSEGHHAEPTWILPRRPETGPFPAVFYQCKPVKVIVPLLSHGCPSPCPTCGGTATRMHYGDVRLKHGFLLDTDVCNPPSCPCVCMCMRVCMCVHHASRSFC